jgi:N-acyl-D-amino-acid deacylase
MHDLVIRNGQVIDGSGAAPFDADVAIDGETIVAVGTVHDRGVEEIDAAGCLVTPGFLDVHTHYDAQVLWDPILAPTSWHGVTTVVGGNCSVGFAPLRPDDHTFPLKVLEAVEEISPDVIDAAVDYDWESFPEYLDALDRRRHTVDIGTQVAHVALRAYVMGDRAEGDEPATAEEITRMCALAEEALRAGALGLSGSRTRFHTYSGGGIVPGTLGAEEELLRLAETTGTVDGRVIQYLGDVTDLDHDLSFTLELARRTKAPLHFIMSDTQWERRLALIERARGEGITLYGHIAPRAVGAIGHWRSVGSPFGEAPSVRALDGLAWDDQLARLREPAFKARVLAELAARERNFFTRNRPENIFEMAAYPDYEPDPATESIAAKARLAGRDPIEYAYDVLTANDGTGLLYIPIANYRSGDFGVVRQLLRTPNILVSLADGGAHSTRVCDAATPTFMLTHWARDRSRGETLPVEHVVHALTRSLAESYGLGDRGLLAPGYLADVNVIDFDRLRLPAPYSATDFPTGGLRLLQKAEGYVATVKRGQITFREGEHCGVFPGQVVRGGQPGPAPASR